MKNIVNQIRVIKNSKLENIEKASMINYIIKQNSRYISNEALFNLGIMCADLYRYDKNDIVFENTVIEMIGVLEK